jgi:hypothetical protein
MHLKLSKVIVLMQNLKTKEDRVKEGLHILNQLKEGGVAQTSGGFVDLKTQVSEWVNSGKSWDGRIEFPEYGRYAMIELPKSAKVVASLAFKRTRGI